MDGGDQVSAHLTSIERELRAAGYRFLRVASGSHRLYQHTESGQIVNVPMHGKCTPYSRQLLARIRRETTSHRS